MGMVGDGVESLRRLVRSGTNVGINSTRSVGHDPTASEARSGRNIGGPDRVLAR